MASMWIDIMIDRVRAFEKETSPRYLKKRLDILGARLKNNKYQSPWYVDPSDAWTLIVSNYDSMMTDIYQHLSYLISLDQYTKQYTNNRGYYCRKKQHIYQYLTSAYTTTPYLLYTMWDIAWEWFFRNPYTRQPLNTTLFYYLMSLQDDKRK